MKTKFYNKKLHCLPFVIGNFDTIINFILKNIKNNKSQIVLPTSLNDFTKNKKEKYYQQIDICTTDGMPIVWYFQYLEKKSKKSFFKIERVYGPDLMKAIIKKTKKSKHAFYGPNKNIIGKLINNLLPNKKGNLILTLSKSNSTKQINKNIKKLSNFQPNILWIGIGSPTQIKLAVQIKNSLPHTTIFCIGAAFDFLSKSKKQAPLFMQNVGLEWLFRFIQEPHRLAKRYFVDIPWFLLKNILNINNKC